MRIRRIVVLCCVLVLAGGLGACGKPEQDALKELRAALAVTPRTAHRFSYEEIAHGGAKIEVQGIVEDALRRQAFVRVGEKPVLEEVVFDDQIAMRFLEPSFVGQLIRAEQPILTGDRPTDEISGAQLGSALSGGKWVLDEAGAPPILAASSTERREMGQDPVFDATSVFEYVERVIRRMPVRKFNPDALDYKPKEDPFPKPAKGSDVVRYDVIRPPVPRPSDNVGGNQAIPSEIHFRKLSVYVKDGLIVQILEDIDVAERLDDVVRNYDLDLEGSVEEQITQAVAAINVVRKGQGELEPLRVRRMSLRLEDLGGALTVRVPQSDVKGNLAFFVNRGKVTSARTAPGATPESPEAPPVVATTPPSTDQPSS